MKCTSKVPVWRKRWWNVIGFIAVSAMLLGPVLACGSGPAPTDRKPKVSCDVKEFANVVPSDTKITSAKAFDTPVNYCKVEGYVTTRGPGPNSNKVNFMVALPDNFNGRFFFVGVGGSVGRVPEPPRAQLTAGYAVAGTDTGNQSDGLDWSFGVDLTKALDYNSRGTHVSTVAGKAITSFYYHGRGSKRPKLFSYITGCSGGARMGIVAAENYPKDFDGVLVSGAGTARINVGGNRIFFGELVQTLQRKPEGFIPPAKLTDLENAVVKEFDAVDGAVDKVVSDPNTVTYAELVKLNDREKILTDAQMQTVRLIVNRYEKADYPGRPANLPTTWSSIMGTQPPPWTVAPSLGKVFQTTSQSLFGLDYDFWTRFNFNDPRQITEWLTRYNEVWELKVGNPDPYLEGFRDAGGKFLFIHGISDSAQAALQTVKYSNDLARFYGGYEDAQKFYRLFNPPGMGHCSGGPGPQDLHDVGLEALANWVEKGEAPTTLVGTNPTSKRSFLLCLYPDIAVFKGGVDNPGKLDPNDYRNWSCAPHR